MNEIMRGGAVGEAQQRILLFARRSCAAVAAG